MISFQKLGEHGRFANQIWQISFLHSMAKRYKTEYQIPKWKYSEYFETQFPEVDEIKPNIQVKEYHYRYDQDFWDSYEPFFQTQTVDVVGYFQNHKYLSDDVRDLFKFKPAYIEAIKSKYADLLTKPTIAVGVRRDDYVTKPGYYNLSVLYYILALQKLDYKNCNIVFISDDLEWCEFHFKCLPNAFFPRFEKDIDQFAFGTLCDFWITANSTFHWWSAYLSNAKKVIQPNHLFADHLYEQYGNLNFYIENEKFEIMEHEGRKIDLTDTTFTIPTTFDHNDRRKNLELIISLLQQNFNTNIVVGEQGGEKFEHVKQWVKYRKFDYPNFHRTKMLNDLAREASTPIVANWDADVMVAPMQLLWAVELIRSREADMVYPYGFLFVRLNKKLHNKIFPKYDLEVFKNVKTGSDTISAPSVGGAVLFDKASFFQGGGENEAFVGYNPEDVERYERFQKLGYKVRRVAGDLYHFDHWCGPNSNMKNPYYTREPLERMRRMTADELRQEVKNWPWAKNYSDEYRLEISSETSAREVFKVLEFSIHPESVLDIGGSTGYWGNGIEDYTVVDFGVPENLLITKNYINHDLRFPLTLNRKFDLVMSLETAEHLEPMYANTIVDSICNHASKYILFSAAIPYQGGHNHFNEQWQSYWVAKFEDRGWYPYHTDIRKELYYNDNVDLWYRNNLLLFTREEYVLDYPINFVHPKYYQEILKFITT